MPSTAEPPRSPFQKSLDALIGQQAPGHSGFRLLLTGLEAFAARAELIRNADERLDLQYYIIHDGISTRLLLEELLQAADRGVQIRLLLDDFASDARDHRILLSTAHPNVHMKVFNPPDKGRKYAATRLLGRLFEPTRQHRRMHNKLMVADNQLAIMGGRNLGDEYFDADPKCNFIDIELLCVGPVAEQLSIGFDEYWNHPLSVPIKHCLRKPGWRLDHSHQVRPLQREIDDAWLNAPEHCARLTTYRQAPQLDAWLRRLIWASGQALWDPPDKVLASGVPPRDQLMAASLLPLALGVRRELMMMSAYFVPTAAGLDYFNDCIGRGVSVAVLTNALEATDVPLVHGGYQLSRPKLLRAGVRLFETRRLPPAGTRYNLADTRVSLHGKAAVFDRRQVLIGPLNFDPRSVLWNTEVGILLDSPALAEEVCGLLEEGMSLAVSYELQLTGKDRPAWRFEDEQGVPRILTRETGGLWRRFNAWLARLLRLEWLL